MANFIVVYYLYNHQACKCYHESFSRFFGIMNSELVYCFNFLVLEKLLSLSSTSALLFAILIYGWMSFTAKD